MRIFFINAVCGTGSTGRIITDLCSMLEKEGHHVKVAYGVGKATGISLDNTVKVSNKIDYYMHNGISRFTDRAGFYSILPTIKLIKEINKFKPDVINIHNIHGYYINIKILFEFLAKKNIPVVWTLHDCWAVTGHCAHFSFINCNKWKQGCYKCLQLNSYPKSYFKDSSKKNYCHKKRLFTSIKKMIIVTPSIWLSNIVKESYLNKYPIKVINNGIDLNIFKPTESNIKLKLGIKDEKMILAVSNVWDEKKGLLDIYNICKKLDSKRFKVVIVGLTIEQLKDVPDNIITIIRTSNLYELAKVYTAADVFINTTYEDTYPTVNMEAIACGTPVVTYKSGGSPEIIDSKSGITVEIGNVDKMIDSIYKILDFSEPLYRNCIKRSDYFDKGIRYRQYLSLFNEVYKDNS